MRGSTPRANPLTEGEIGAVLGRIGLLASDDRLRCVPLDGGVSSDIWRIEIGARRYCLKRALPRLKVAQLWEAPVGRNTFEWQWFRAAGAICPECVPQLVAHDPQVGLFVMDYLDPKSYPVWKTQLRDGVVHAETAERVAQRLVRIHAATSNDEHVARQFATDDAFHAIRLVTISLAESRIRVGAEPAHRLAHHPRAVAGARVA